MSMCHYSFWCLVCTMLPCVEGRSFDAPIVFNLAFQERLLQLPSYVVDCLSSIIISTFFQKIF